MSNFLYIGLTMYKLTLQKTNCSMCVAYYMYVSLRITSQCCIPLIYVPNCLVQYLGLPTPAFVTGSNHMGERPGKPWHMPIHQGECLGKCHIPGGSEHTTDCKHGTWSDWAVKNLAVSVTLLGSRKPSHNCTKPWSNSSRCPSTSLQVRSSTMPSSMLALQRINAGVRKPYQAFL